MIELTHYQLIYSIDILLQAFIVNDVELSPGPKSLLFDKHIEYIANHGKDQNDFVSVSSKTFRNIFDSKKKH